MSNIDELLITYGLLNERRPQSLPWEAGNLAEDIKMKSKVKPDGPQGNNDTHIDQNLDLDNETQPCIMPQATADTLQTHFALGELPIDNLPRGIQKRNEDKGKTSLTKKIVDVGLDTKPPKYEMPRKYPTHMVSDTQPPKYAVTHIYSTHVTKESSMQHCIVDGQRPPFKGYFIENRLHGLSEDKTTYETPKASSISPHNTEHSSNMKECGLNVVNCYDSFKQIKGIPKPTLDTSAKKLGRIGKMNCTTAVTKGDHAVSLSVFATAQSSASTKPFMLNDKPSVNHTHSDKSMLSAIPADQYFNGNVKGPIARGLKDASQTVKIKGFTAKLDDTAHQKLRQTRRLNLIDSDTKVKVEEILSVTNDLYLSNQPCDSDHTSRKQTHQKNRLNDKDATALNETISKILNSSDDESDRKSKSEYETNRGRRMKRDNKRRRTRRDSSGDKVSMVDNDKHNQHKQKSKVTVGNDTDEDVDELLKSTATLIAVKPHKCTDKRRQLPIHHMCDILKPNGNDRERTFDTVKRSRRNDQHKPNLKKHSNITVIEPEEVRRRKRRKRLEIGMKDCSREMKMKTQSKYSLSKSDLAPDKEDVFDISPVKDRGYQESDSENNPSNGIDALTEFSITVPHENGDNCVVSKVKKSKSRTHSVVNKDVKTPKDNDDKPKTKVRRGGETNERNTKKGKKKRKEENQCYEKRINSEFNVEETNAEILKPNRKRKKRVGSIRKEKDSSARMNAQEVDYINGADISCQNVNRAIQSGENEKVNSAQDNEENVYLNQRIARLKKNDNPNNKVKDELCTQNNGSFYHKKEENINVELSGLMYDSSDFWSDDGYTSDSPIPWIRGASSYVESADWVFPMPEPDRQYDPDQYMEQFNGKVEILETGNENITGDIVKCNGDKDEKTKKPGKIRTFFRRLFCCFKPKVEH